MQKTPTPDLNKIAFSKKEIDPEQPTIIFLHDSLGCIDLWRDFPEKLGKQTNCNVLVYDRQGYGKSCPFSYEQRTNAYMEWEADILVKLMDFWQLEKVILFGHSDGGSIALIAAGKYPNRFQGVITEGAHIFVEDITLEGIREAKEIYHTTDLHQKLEKYHGEKTEAMFRAWSDTWLMQEFRRWNIESYLPSINCPVLVMQGELDEYGSLLQVEGILNGIKTYTEKVILPGVKHSPHKEKPEIIREISTTFVNKCKANK